MVKVSVIVPVYNTEKYLAQMLESICTQTLKEIEIICIDDGSKDRSLQILNAYAQKDCRMIVLKQRNAGAGAARNRGLKAAKGKYLSILDSDDFFEKDMLEKAYTQCENDGTDLCVYRSDRFRMPAGKYEAIPWTIQKKYLPSQIPFGPQEIYPYIFQIFNGWAWDKLYRRDTVAASGLQFQNLRTTNDAFFVFLMNLQVKKITILDETLAHHRTNVKTSLSVTREQSWDCCWKAVEAIRQELVQRNQYAIAEQSFINWALHFLLWNVHSMRQAEVKRAIRNKMCEQYFPQLEMEKYPESFFYNRNEYLEYKNLCQPDSLKKTLHQIYLRTKIKFFG